jgi:DNA-binding winged helix-turn-helix (wHTH) protein/Tol biopolymer transport system component
VFEYSERTGELRKSGSKVRLQDQSRLVLTKLLTHSGELVTREELRTLVWPKDTFVDFETGLNTIIKRLREALGDFADRPAFIETVPRRGYRFIAGVEIIPDQSRPASAISPLRRRRRKTRVVAAVSVVVLSMILGLIYWQTFPSMQKVTKVSQVTGDAQSKLPMNLFVTDGVHLYFMEGTPWAGGSRIAQVAAVGGETTEVVTPLKEILAIYAISPDFSELLVANGVAVQADPTTGRSDGAAEVWAQPLPAGTPHRVGQIYATDACYAPDRRHILYADGRTLIMIDPDGSNPRELARVRGVVRGLRYSPDGKRIRFHIQVSPGFDRASIWEINADGSNLHPLLPNWKESPFQCCGNWSADGKYYFFRAGRGNDQAIWTIPEHRSFFARGAAVPSRLISGPLRLSDPVPSRDGTKLFVMGEALRVEPIRYDSKTRRFESYFKGTSTNSFDISPDPNWIAYVSYPDMNLWRSRIDGTDKRQLTLAPVRAYGPKWSPDGSRIAFTDVRFEQPWSIGVVSASGGPPKFFKGADPTWTPNGRSLICGRDKPDNEAPFAGIFRLDLDSGNASFIPNSEGRYSARLSPDGRYIAAFSQAATDLLLFDSRTSHWSSLATGELFSYNQWSHDGKYIYMRDNHAGIPRIVRVQMRSGRMEQVVSLKDLPQVVDVFTGWIGLTPEDDPILIRDRSTHEIYALDLE